MTTEATAIMHQRFVEEIGEKIAALEEELRTLQAVQDYHAQQLGELGKTNSKAPSPSRQHTPNDVTHRRIAKLLRDAKKTDAARIALEHLGRPAKIGEIIDVLWENGYAVKMERRILHNTLYTAMTRREDIFRKLPGGLWSLKRAADAEDEEDQPEE